MATREGLLLGIDLGTSSVKAVLIDAEGVSHGRASAEYPVVSPEPGWAESAPDDWWRATGEAVRRAVGSRGADVAAVGVSGQMHGVVMVDHAGAALRAAVLWPDTRSTAQLHRYRALEEAALARLGNPLVTGMAGPSLLWLRDHEPDVYGAARWAVQPKDWLRMRLTGVAASEPSDASATLLYDVPGDRWDLPLVEELGLRPDLLAPLTPSGHPAGALLPAAAEDLGLPPGVCVAVGAADTAAAALGNGLLEPGPTQLSIGTGGQLLAPRDTPLTDPRRRTHLYRAAAPRRWYAMAAMLNAGLALEWARGVVGASWDEVYAEAFAVPAGAGGVRFLPYLAGERTPHLDSDLRGCWLNLGLGHHRGHLLRAALEGVAFTLRDGLAALESVEAWTEQSDLRLTGGGSLHPAWRQLLADVLVRPLVAVDSADASARGAALLGGVAEGVFPDFDATVPLAPGVESVTIPQEESDVYEAGYADFRSSYLQLHGGGDHTPTAQPRVQKPGA